MFFSHARGHVVSRAVLRKALLSQNAGSTFIFEGLVRLECRNVPPVRSTLRVLLRFQRQDVAGCTLFVVEVDVGETFPAAADADDFAIALRAR